MKKTEGEPKEVIDIYKQVLVSVPAAEQRKNLEEEISRYLKPENKNGRWYSQLEVNPQLLDYGEKQAEIVDFALVDEDGKINSGIVKGSEFTIKMKVEFHEDISDPLFCFTIKDPQGTEVTGTNTMLERIDTGLYKAGTEHVVEFKQKMTLQGRSYLLSLGVVGFGGGRFTVYHRLYDVCDINVISDKNTVGFYDMDSTTTIDGKVRKRD